CRPKLPHDLIDQRSDGLARGDPKNANSRTAKATYKVDTQRVSGGGTGLPQYSLSDAPDDRR
ncbi:hypothetical protein, partial [Luteimonas sp. TWI1437]|uniref:hypothetical protein n=1 Tax=unclassified Luteimonas TaxID=2629088 RepID=UPI00320B222D